MIDLLLSSSKGWPQVIGIIVGFFIVVFILASVYGKIDEKTKVDKKSEGCGWPVFLIIVACIVGAMINMKSCSCKGSHGGGYDSEEEYWENTPRHTQNVNFKKNNVNSIIFTTSKACYIINKV